MNCVKHPSHALVVMMQLLISFMYMLIQNCFSLVRYFRGCTESSFQDIYYVWLLTMHLFVDFQDYPTFESPPLTITPLDLGPKHAYKLGAAPFKKWVKTYSKDYVLGQLIFWYKPNEAEPGASLAKASRGCLILTDPTSCYAKSPQHRLSYTIA